MLAKRQSGWRLVAPTLLLLSFALIIVPHLGRTIQHDEALSVLAYARSPLLALFYYEVPNNHLLHSFLLWLSTTLIGDSLVAIRFPAFVAGLLAIAMLYRVGTRIAGRSAGLLAGAWCGVSPLYAEYATNARGYTLSVLLALVLFDAVYRAPERPSRKRGWGLFGVSMLLIMTLPTMALWIGSVLLWSPLTPTIRAKRLWVANYWPPILFGALTGTLFYAHVLLLDGGPGALVARGYGLNSLWEIASVYLDSVFGSPAGIALALGLLVGVRGVWRERHPFGGVLGVAVGVAVVLALVQFMLTGRGFYPRVYSYLTPFIALAGAIGARRVLEIVLGAVRWRFATPIAFVLIVAVGGWSLRGLSDPTEMDDLYQAISHHAESGDALMIGCCMDYAMYYMFGTESGYFERTADSRVVIIPTVANSRRVIEERFDLEPDLICTPVQWDRFEVFICPPGES